MKTHNVLASLWKHAVECNIDTWTIETSTVTFPKGPFDSGVSLKSESRWEKKLFAVASVEVSSSLMFTVKYVTLFNNPPSCPHSVFSALFYIVSYSRVGKSHGTTCTYTGPDIMRAFALCFAMECVSVRGGAFAAGVHCAITFQLVDPGNGLAQ